MVLSFGLVVHSDLQIENLRLHLFCTRPNQGKRVTSSEAFVKEVALLLAHLLGALLGLGTDLSARLSRLLVADLVGHLPADGLRDVDLDGVAVGDPPLHVGDGADGPAGNAVAVTAWDRVTVLLGHPVAPWAVTSLVLLLLLLLLLVPEGRGPLASVAAVALSDIRGGALLLVALLTHLTSVSSMAMLNGLAHNMVAALLLSPGVNAFLADLSVFGGANIPDGVLADLGDQLSDELSPASTGNGNGNGAGSNGNWSSNGNGTSNGSNNGSSESRSNDDLTGA